MTDWRLCISQLKKSWQRLAILKPDHLFEQAARLLSRPQAGAPRQVDLRRAISTAYYGLFHFALTAAADEFAGTTQRTTSRYALIYRSIGHGVFRDLCNEVQKRHPPARYRAYFPKAGFGQNIRDFAAAAVDLQLKRHLADYDPQPTYNMSEADLAINTAITAIRRFKNAGREERAMFLTLLLCPPR